MGKKTPIAAAAGQKSLLNFFSKKATPKAKATRSDSSTPSTVASDVSLTADDKDSSSVDVNEQKQKIEVGLGDDSGSKRRASDEEINQNDEEEESATPVVRSVKKRRVIEESLSDEEVDEEESIQDEPPSNKAKSVNKSVKKLESCKEENEPPSKKAKAAQKEPEKKTSATKKASNDSDSTTKTVKSSTASKKKPLAASGWGFLSGKFESKKKKKATATPGKKNVKQAYTGGDDLPIISHPQAMFDDMVFQQLNDPDMLKPLLLKLKDRPLRIATMCSGTESPVLALDMLSNSIQDYAQQHDMDGELLIEHVFSCEIEPFKQAYIERNFQPPRLFRDIRELGKNQAYTAYGSLANVPNTPGCVDMLVAGTSCVDYSNLNNEKKTIEEKGESGQTFRGMIEWVKKAEPPIVILENVYGAPWPKKVELFESMGYFATFKTVDTKQYYIPHTRQRGYLFAVMKGSKALSSRTVEKWKYMLQQLQRPASATLDAFMLPNNDPRVLRGRARLSAGSESSTNRTDWAKCESRHLRQRTIEELGDKRPLTGWSDSGNTTMPSFAWNEWMNAQVNRIHDLSDINTLRLAKEGVDCTYKSCVWNLSQNVDRDTMGKLGLCQCLTPTGVPYVTNRGGVLVGEELLLLQGIPADDLLLTKETEENLKDLAGNAMSTTVVGACMLTALLLGHSALCERQKRIKDVEGVAIVPNLVPRPLVPASNEIKIVMDMGDYRTSPLCLGPANPDCTISRDFFQRADSSARKCLVEGYDKCIPTSSLVSCQQCGQTSSAAFAFPPRKYEEHDFRPVTDCGKTRIQPDSFRAELLKLLPMRFQLGGFDCISSINMPEGMDKALWEAWKNAMDAATKSTEFRFSKVTRNLNCWTVHFESASCSRVELRISLTGAQWFLFAQAPSERGLLRDALERPVARMLIKADASSLLRGQWEVLLPTDSAVELSITGSGELVSSWASRLGLKGAFEKERRFEKLTIQLKSNGGSCLDKKVDGEYIVLPKCGAACGSLHKRVDCDEDQMYFFLESGRCTLGAEDYYIFSNSRARTEYGEYRDIALRLDAKYRPEFAVESEVTPEKEKLVRAYAPVWIKANVSIIVISDDSRNTVSSPAKQGTFSVTLAPDGWKRCPEILSADIPMAGGEKLYKQCARGGVGRETMEVHLQKSAFLFQSLAFATSRLSIPDAFCQEWLSIGSSTSQKMEGNPSEVCAPVRPHVKWSVVSKGGKQLFVPIEDGKEASVYEQALKKRPNPWKVHLFAASGVTNASDAAKKLKFQVGCNVNSLTNRALGLFPQSLERENAKVAGEEICFHWRIVSHVEKSSGNFPKLYFTSNKMTPEAEQPPNFSAYNLRPEQLRSLSWMLSQESSKDPFMEEEIAESVLPSLNWRAEARVRRPVLVRGGIVADQVGYGKTAITLGLIDAAPSVNGDPPAILEKLSNSFVSTRATLVIVPGHLMSQWPNEVKKFLGESKRVIVLKDMSGFNKITSKEIQEADIVIVNFTVLSSELYFRRLARLAGADPSSLPSGKGGKHFDAVYNECLTGLSERVVSLKGDCSNVFDCIERDSFAHSEKEVEETVRLDGKKAVYKAVSEEQTKVGSSGRDRKLSSSRAKGKSGTVKTEFDPWGLSTAQVKKDSSKMKCPPLEMFFWNRIVVDEFHYLEEKKDRARVLTLVLGLKSSFRWCLSGTPPHENFNDVQSLAKLLGIHLGVDESLPGTRRGNKNSSETSGLEKFSEMLEMRSVQWHQRRHEVAQLFLDRFVRQNIAEIDEIKFEEHMQFVDLPPAEKAIYLELETHLKSLEMNKKKARKSKKATQSDRDNRMQKVLENSASAEEALLKRCSHFNMCGKEKATAAETCSFIAKLRQEQLQECENQLKDSIVSALKQRKCILTLQPDWEGCPRTEKDEVQDTLSIFLADVKLSQSIPGGADDEIHSKLAEIVEAASEKIPKDEEGSKKRKRSSKKDEDESSLVEMKWALRNHMHTVRSDCKELCGRIRSLRYFQWVCKFQQETTISCPSPQCMKQKGIDMENSGVLSCCGHVGCLRCLNKCADAETCIDPSCRAQIKRAHVVPADSLGAKLDLGPGGGQYGAKLTLIVDKVQSLVQDGDRVIVFVQFQDLKEKVAEALEKRNVKTLQVKGSVQKQVKALDVLQKVEPGANDPRCLLLTLDDETSAGVNLTTCNHAVFVHPLLVDSRQQYDAYETQAIGRIRRYGQTKTVHVWRYLASDTIDTEIYNERTKRDDTGTGASA